MDTQENPRGEQGVHGDAASPDETGNGGEDEGNTYKNDDEADLGEPIPSPVTIAEVENPSSSTSIDAAGAPGENRDEAMEDFAEVGNPSSSTSINAAGAPAENRDEAMEDLAEVENPSSSTSINAAEAPAENCDEVMENFDSEEPEKQKSSKELPIASEDPSSDSISEEIQNTEISEAADKSPDTVKLSDDEEEEDEPPPKKQKNLSLLTPGTAGSSQLAEMDQCGDETEQSEPKSANGNGSNTNGKKSKKKSKNNNVWAKPASRKGKKKAKNNGTTTATPKAEDTVLIAPAPRCPDKNDDSPDMKICLSKFYKAEKVELSEDRLCAGSCKGYRMVRATRGVSEGAWYFEIKLLDLGETGHTRLGWSTEKGDLQAPVGYDANSYGYRDTDGSKIHKALRERYGEEGYTEGDVIGFYINLPEGNLYAPKQPNLVMYKGQRYVCPADAKLDPPKVVPGSEISFFKNGVCQGVAFRDLYGGRYYPAASMYTLPNQPICLVRFNFGPNFERFPEDFEGRPVPSPMIEIPYQGVDNRSENGESSEKNQ